MAAIVGTFVGCSRPSPTIAFTERLRDYLANRTGIAKAGIQPRSWLCASIHDQVESARVGGKIRVLEWGDGFLTEDGERLPSLFLDSVSAVDLDAALACEYNLPEEIEEQWRNLYCYVVMGQEARDWVVSQLRPNALPIPVLGDWVVAELDRLVLQLRDQSIPWSRIVRTGAALVRMCEAGEAPDASTRLARAHLVTVEASARFAAETALQDWDLAELRVRSELDSVGGAWLHDATTPNRGHYAANVGDLFWPNLRAMLKYWDCDVWTRSVVRVGGKVRAVTIGERVRARAAKLMDVPVCQLAEFETWVAARGR